MEWNDLNNELANSTANNNDIAVSDRTMQQVNEVLDDFRNGPCKSAIDRVTDFLKAASENPEDVTDAYLTYFAGDPAKGREIISKLGIDATFADLDAAMKDGTIQ